MFIEHNPDDKSDDQSDLGGAEGKPSISLKQIKFCLRQSDKLMGQANRSALHKWKNEWVPGFGEKRHGGIMWRLNHLNDP